MSGIASLFAGMDNAPMMGGGQYFESGRFVAQLKSPLKVHKGFKGKSFIAEFTVCESSNPAVKPGDTRSYVIKMDNNQYAFGDIKKLVIALALEIDPKSVQDQNAHADTHKLATKIVSAACDSDYAAELAKTEPDVIAIVGMLVGQKVNVETYQKPTRPKPGSTEGGVFTVHTFWPYA